MTKRGFKQFYRRYKKVINRIIVCVVLLMIILMFWNYVSDLHKHINLLAKYNHKQALEISNLHGQVSASQNIIHDLQNKITYITNQKTSSIKVQYHQQPIHKEDTSFISDAPTIIVTVMTIVGGLIKNLIPIF